jgi:hypothetical protein
VKAVTAANLASRPRHIRLGASGRGVQQARAVERDAPDLYAKVLAGDVALDAADKERKQRLKALGSLDARFLGR